MTKKLWVDDVRPPPDDSWEWARTFHAACFLLEKQEHSTVSLDHDLGCYYGYKEMTGMDILAWLEKRKFDGLVIPSTILVHTRNAAVKDTMVSRAEKLSETSSSAVRL